MPTDYAELLAAGLADQFGEQGTALTYVRKSISPATEHSVRGVITTRDASLVAAVGGDVSTASGHCLLNREALPFEPAGGDHLREASGRRWRVVAVVTDFFDPAWHLELQKISV